MKALQQREQAEGEAERAMQARAGVDADYKALIAANKITAVGGRRSRLRTAAGAAVVLVAGFGIGTWYGLEAPGPAQRVAEPVTKAVPIPVAGPLAEARGLPLPLRVEDDLERFNRSLGVSAAGGARAPAR